MSFKLTIGRLAFAGRDLFTNEAIAALPIIDERIIERQFLYYALSNINWIKLAENDAKLKGLTLNKAKLARVDVSFPKSLAEQRRIVAILDEAFAGLATMRANAEANLKNARALFDSHLNAVFSQGGEGWQEAALVDLGRLQTGTTPRTSEAGMKGSHIPFIKPGDFRRDGSLDYANEGLSAEGLANSRLVQGGSALMVCIGATIGKAGFAERDIACNQQVNAVTPRAGIDGKFLYYQMLTPDFQRAVIRSSGQATLPIISKGKWGALTMKFPKSEERQRAIVASLDDTMRAVEELESIGLKKLAAIDALKQSILAKAFAGELTSAKALAA